MFQLPAQGCCTHNLGLPAPHPGEAAWRAQLCCAVRLKWEMRRKLPSTHQPFLLQLCQALPLSHSPDLPSGATSSLLEWSCNIYFLICYKPNLNIIILSISPTWMQCTTGHGCSWLQMPTDYFPVVSAKKLPCSYTFTACCGRKVRKQKLGLHWAFLLGVSSVCVYVWGWELHVHRADRQRSFWLEPQGCETLSALTCNMRL